MSLVKPHGEEPTLPPTLAGPAATERTPRDPASTDPASTDPSSADSASTDPASTGSAPPGDASRGSASPDPPLPELETARLRLRQFSMADVDDFARLTGDAEVMRYIGPGVPIERDEAVQHLGRIVAAFRRRGYGKWALVSKDDGRLVGYCGLGFSFEDVGVELVYLLARECWGRGLASEASRAALGFGFERMGLASIAALTKADNLRSRRVLERLGMTFVRACRYEDYDCALYSIRRDEFDAARARAGRDGSPGPEGS